MFGKHIKNIFICPVITYSQNKVILSLGDPPQGSPSFIYPDIFYLYHFAPLEDLEVWEANLEIQEFKAMEQHQVNRLIGFLGILHGEWKGCTPDVFERQAGDYLRLCLEGKKDWPTLQRMARTGALFDVFEWKNFIEK